MNNLLDRQRLPAEPRLIALGSGAGGTGKTTLACDLARVFVRRGSKALVVDADIGNPNVHFRLDVTAAEIPATRWRDDGPLDALIIPATRNRPAILPLGLVISRPFARLDTSAARLVSALRALNYDDVIIDLPTAPDPVWSSVFALCDVPIVVAPTEAVSILGATRYLRAALFYALLAHPGAEHCQFELLRALDSLDPNASAEDFRVALGSERLRALLDSTLDRFQTYLVLAQTHENAERDLGHSIAMTWSFVLDVWPRYLGAFDHDDRRWFRQRHDQKTALSAEVSAEGTCEAIAKELADLPTFDASQPRTRRANANEAWQKLGVSPELDPVSLRQSYRRLWEGFRRDSPLTLNVLQKPKRDAIIRELEDANRVLQIQLAESGAIAPIAVPLPTRPQSRRPGDPIRDARQRLDLSQRELSLQTKIGLRYLEAIEQFEVDDLPRPVYLRGYLREIAGAVGLDAETFMDEYLTAVSEARSSRILSRTSSNRRRS